jgi:hypothetical protein
MSSFYTTTQQYCTKCKRWTTHIDFRGVITCESCKTVSNEQKSSEFVEHSFYDDVSLDDLAMELFQKHFSECSVQERSIIREEQTRRDREQFGW